MDLILNNNADDHLILNKDGDKTNVGSTIDTLWEKYAINGHDFVEIGGVKWATMNVGAESPTDNGLYFTWADTRGYTSSQVGGDSKRRQKRFIETDYKWEDRGGAGWDKYNGYDGKFYLDLEDDPVHVHWGGSWRMPTTDEFVALGAAVNSVWTSSYQGSGVSGLVLTDKTDSSKVLFFPAAGWAHENSITAVGTYGFYWTNFLERWDGYGHYYYERAYARYFKKEDYISYGTTQRERYYGLSVRGVLDF